MKIWLAWIVIASAAATAVPLGPFGLLGWLGAVGPLLRELEPSLSSRRVAAIVLASMLVVVLFDGELQWFEILMPVVALVVGIWLAPDHALDEANASESLTRRGRLALQEFERAMARELGRARRYERPFTLLTATPGDPNGDLRRLEAAIAAQVHVYCQIFSLDGQLLVIVPELGAQDCLALQQRILEAAAEHHVASVAIGSATFPEAGVTTSGLRSAADASRRLLSTARATVPPAPGGSNKPGEFAPEPSSP